VWPHGGPVGQHGGVSPDDDGWAEDDPEYLLARIRAVADSMAKAWRGRPLPLITAELRHRLARLVPSAVSPGQQWPPELLELLARDIGDPRWPWKHPVQAWDLSRRYHAAARARTP
jgi:hypothetical protein